MGRFTASGYNYIEEKTASGYSVRRNGDGHGTRSLNPQGGCGYTGSFKDTGPSRRKGTYGDRNNLRALSENGGRGSK